MSLNVVLFDLDGTLTDSQAGIIASYRHALHTLGLEVKDAEVRALIGPPLEDNLIALGVPHGQVAPAVAAYRDYYSNKGMYDNKLFEGIPQVLATLAAAGTVLGLATSKLVDPATAILEYFGISQYFTAVSGATRDGRLLHKTEVAQDALEALGVPNQATVALVGDRENDMWAAGELDLFGVGALWGYGSENELLSAGAQALAGSPEELLPLLLS